MAASFPLRQVPLGLLLRRQSRVNSITKRFQTTAATSSTLNAGYPLYPSVSQLLLQRGISDESEIAKIPATGPKGRLLKGDVLAYFGDIQAGYPAEQAARIEKMGHLDLSNITIAPPPAPPKAEAPVPVEELIPELPSDISVAVSISLESVLSTQKRIKDALGITVPLSTFIARATEIANGELPRSSSSKPSANELFDEIVGAATTAIKSTRGSYIPEINTVSIEEFESFDEDAALEEKEEDIIDILSGNVSRRSFATTATIPEPSSPAAALNVFSLTVPAGEEGRAKTFLDRLSTVLTVDPGRLVL